MSGEATLFDNPKPDIDEQRAKLDAAKAIEVVIDSYKDSANKASAAELDQAAWMYWWMVRELKRAKHIALTGEDPGDGSRKPT